MSDDSKLEGLWQSIAEAFPEGKADLDRLGEFLHGKGVSTEEIYALFDRFEGEGFEVRSRVLPPLIASLKEVLASARDLKSEGVAQPSVAAIGARAGMPESEVRTALLFGQTLKG